jgi:6-phosphogluconolactonase
MKSGANYDLQIFDTPDALNHAAARFIAELADKAISARGRFAIALSGGHTPENLYDLLSKPPFRYEFDWTKTFIFWGDERCVSTDDTRNNSYMARSLLLDHVAIPSSNIHPVPVDLPPDKAALAYANTIKNFFGNYLPCFDLILLGLGENGHTASLFPGSKILSEHVKLVCETYIEEQNMFRITMTEKLINLAYNIIFLVEGKEKAEILDKVINGAYQPHKYPAQLIKPLNSNLYWFVDHTAASLL